MDLMFTSIHLEHREVIADLYSEHEQSQNDRLLPLLSPDLLPTSLPPAISSGSIDSGLDLDDLSLSNTTLTDLNRRSHFGRFISSVHNVTRRLRLRRLHYHRHGRIDPESSMTITPSDPYYETAIPILSSSSAYSRLTSRFITHWNPVRIRRDSQYEHEETQRRFGSRLFGRGVNTRRSLMGDAHRLSISTDSDLLTFIDASETSSFTEEPAIGVHYVDQNTSYPQETDTDQLTLSNLSNLNRDQNRSNNVTRASTFSRIVRFSFRHTRPSIPRPQTHPTPTSGSVPNEEKTSSIESYSTTSTGSTSKNPVTFRRKTFRYSVGRNRDLYKMLGSFDDFYKDPLSESTDSGTKEENYQQPQCVYSK